MLIGKRILFVLRLLLNIAGFSFLATLTTTGYIVAGALLGTSFLFYAVSYVIDRQAMIKTARSSADVIATQLRDAGKNPERIADLVHEVFQKVTTPRFAFLLGHISAINFVLDRPGSNGVGPHALHAIILIVNVVVVAIVAFMFLVEEPIVNAWGCYVGWATQQAPLAALEYGVCPQYFDATSAPVCSKRYPEGGPYFDYNVPGYGVTLPSCSTVDAAKNILDGPRNAAFYVLLISVGHYIGAAAERANDLDMIAAQEQFRI